MVLIVKLLKKKVMKNIKYVLPIFLAAMISCTKEAPATDGPENPDTPAAVTMLSASIDGDVTKTAMGAENAGKYPVTWSEGDRIRLNGGAESADAVIADGAKTASFNFGGEISAPFKAVYPSSVWKPEGVIAIPAEQTYVKGAFDPGSAVMLAYSDDSNLNFRHIMSYLYVTFTSENVTENIKTVEVKSLGTESMSGDFNVTFAAEGCTVAAAEANQAAVRVNCPDLALGTPVVVAVPAQTYASGVVVTVTYSDDTTKDFMSAGSFEAKAGKVYPLDLEIKAPGIYNVEGYEAFAAALNKGESVARWQDDHGVVNLYANLTKDENYTYISKLSVSFNGHGHSITCNKKSRPLFNTIAAGVTVSNLTTAGTYVYLEAGGEQAFASFARVNLGTIDHCTNTTSGELTATTGTAFGAFVGQNGGVISNSTNEGSISLTMQVPAGKKVACYGGGFAAYGHTTAGTSAGTFTNCTNKGNVIVNVTTGAIIRTGFGGICGVVIADGVVFDGCRNEATVKRQDDGAENITAACAVGGILGRSVSHFPGKEHWLDMDGNKKFNTKFTGCVNTGTVIDAVYNEHNFQTQNSDELGNKKVCAGGIVGAVMGKVAEPVTLVDCSNIGKVQAGYSNTKNSHVGGGLVGMASNVSLTNCVAEGVVEPTLGNIAGALGGMIGFARVNATISGGTTKPAVSVTTVSSPTKYSYGLVFGCVRPDGKASVSGVKIGGSITVNGTAESISATNYTDYICKNVHFTAASAKPMVSECPWSE